MWRIVVVISPRLTGMGHVTVTLVDWVTRARACIRRTGATVNNIASFAVSQSLSPFSLPVLLAELSLMITFRLPIVADIHPLVIVDLH
jgi:hypothetical protein